MICTCFVGGYIGICPLDRNLSVLSRGSGNAIVLLKQMEQFSNRIHTVRVICILTMILIQRKMSFSEDIDLIM